MEITVTTATSKALRIPEIVHAIVSFLWRYRSSALQHQLCSLILVCRDLHQICTPLLWRNLSLQGGAMYCRKAFPFPIKSKYSLLEPESKPRRRRQLLLVCWFKQGLRKYGSLVRSIDWRDLREGEYHCSDVQDLEDVRIGLKRNRMLFQTAQGGEESTEGVDVAKGVHPGDLPAYDFDNDTDDDEMEDKLLNSETFPKDDGGVKLRTWILKFCPNLEQVTIRHLRAGMDIYRPFLVEAARRTRLSSITIIIEDRDCSYSYSGNTLTDFFESVTGIMNNDDSTGNNANVSTRDIVPSKGITGARSGSLLKFSMEDVSYYEGGGDRGQEQPWSLITRMLDTHPNLRSFRLYYFNFKGGSMSSSSYPAMRRVEVNLDGFNEENLSCFLSLFPKLEILHFTIREVSVSNTLALIRQRCPLISDLEIFLTPTVHRAERREISRFVKEFQHSMPHLTKLTTAGLWQYSWVAPTA